MSNSKNKIIHSKQLGKIYLENVIENMLLKH